MYVKELSSPKLKIEITTKIVGRKKKIINVFY